MLRHTPLCRAVGSHGPRRAWEWEWGGMRRVRAPAREAGDCGEEAGQAQGQDRRDKQGARLYALMYCTGCTWS
jgi:hypothetical protein